MTDKAGAGRAVEQRLTPAQFRALVAWKGWTHQELATRWDVSRTWVTKICSNPARPARYDDAVRGLPNKRTQSRDWSVLRKRLASLLPAEGGNQDTQKKIKVTGEYRWHSYITVGSILTASVEIGSIAEAGMRGIAFQVIDSGAGETYGVIFETGLWDWFSPKYVDDLLVPTGLEDDAMQNYQHQDEDQLQELFASGHLNFWPQLPPG